MVFNAAGLLAVAEFIFRPHLLVPKLVVEGTSYANHALCVFATARNVTDHPTSHVDIRALKLDKLKARGVIGVVLDKDNCLVSSRTRSLPSTKTQTLISSRADEALS